MTPLFCTTILLQHLPPLVRSDASPDGDRGRLGAWTATLVAWPPTRLVLALSDHGRLPLVLAADPVDDVLDRLPEALYALLLDLKVAPDLARRERDAMQPLCPSSGVAAGVLGPLAALQVALRALWDGGDTRDPAQLSLLLAHQSSEHLEGGTPAQAARRHFHLVPTLEEPLGL